MECTWAASPTATRWVLQHAQQRLRVTAAQDAVLGSQQKGNSGGAKESQVNLVTAGGSKTAFRRSYGCDVLHKDILRGGPRAPRPTVRPRATVVQVMTGQDPRSSPLPELHKAAFPFPS